MLCLPLIKTTPTLPCQICSRPLRAFCTKTGLTRYKKSKVCTPCRKRERTKPFHRFNLEHCSLCNRLILRPNMSLHRKYDHTKFENLKYRVESSSAVGADNMIRYHTYYTKKYYPYKNKWEFMFALWLESKGEKFDYEQYRFPVLDNRGIYLNYVPDFYIHSNNTFVEICTTYNRHNNVKCDWFVNQHLKENLEIWTPKQFKEFDIIPKFEKYLPVSNEKDK